MASLDDVFQRWLDTGEITVKERQRLENDDTYRGLLLNAEQWQKMSSQYDEQAVPKWNRESTWFEKTKASDWTSFINRLSALFAPTALVCSMALCSLVVLNAQISTNESGISITFNQAPKQPEVTLSELQELFANHQKQSSQATYALVREAIEQGRIERKEDINALVSHLNDIRQQDQALIRLQLHELAEQVESQPQSSIAKNNLD